MSLRAILASEGLVASTIPANLLDYLTSGGQYQILSQEGGKILTNGGAHYKTNARFAAFKFSDLNKAAESLQKAKSEGKGFAPIMKAFRNKKEALDWLDS